jgi:hypothetical protein
MRGIPCRAVCRDGLPSFACFVDAVLISKDRSKFVAQIAATSAVRLAIGQGSVDGMFAKGHLILEKARELVRLLHCGGHSVCRTCITSSLRLCIKQPNER